MTLLLTIIILYFIVNPKICIQSALSGAQLFVNAILPSLFPFMVICNMLIAFDGITIYSNVLGPILCRPLKLSKNCSFAIIASLLCGYPLGAKYSAELYKNGYITKNEFNRLLNIASNAGPLFILGSVASSMLNNIYYGYIILAANYLSAFIIGLVTAENNHGVTMEYKGKVQTKNLGEIMKNAISDGINGILMVGGYVIIFSIIISILKNNVLSTIISTYFLDGITINRDLISAFFLGIIDLTNGCYIITSSSLDIPIKLCFLSFLCSFGSFSVIAQTSAFFYKYEVSLLKYVAYKIIQGIIGAIITFLASIFLLNTIPTFSSTLTNSTMIVSAPFILLLILTIITIIANKLLHAS
ncbi:sporulation integral membrane protein YlbJ [Clostridium polyendosporum]|uniref:Sporulation integral membrane protein YlbJ n=1 Tax=Clostridium polyendosporum TaxID=69208 RepID=A0A919VKR4_9CLOT|nr:sporulation integral membrane protein YlbJ [Clostridium polyendosporum]GIM27843.1 sporulation integral membrane protein YlbJ [Clostridium polyendosporum]